MYFSILICIKSKSKLKTKLKFENQCKIYLFWFCFHNESDNQFVRWISRDSELYNEEISDGVSDGEHTRIQLIFDWHLFVTINQKAIEKLASKSRDFILTTNTLIDKKLKSKEKRNICQSIYILILNWDSVPSITFKSEELHKKGLRFGLKFSKSLKNLIIIINAMNSLAYNTGMPKGIFLKVPRV